MAEVSSASASVAKALTGAVSSVGESSLGRVVAGFDAVAHNLIDGAISPATRAGVKRRGYQYRNHGANGPDPVLSSQQLQVTKTSTDQRIIRIQRDCVSFLTRACQTSDALGHKHPSFDDEGAVHLRLTLPVPTTSSIDGFQRRRIGKGGRPGKPKPGRGGEVDTSESAAGAGLRESGGHGSGKDDGTLLSGGGDGRTPKEAPGNGGERPVASGSPRDGKPTPLGTLGQKLEEGEGTGLPSTEVATRRCPSVFDCTYAMWLKLGAARGCVDSVCHTANVSGSLDLYVVDVVVPTEVYTACMETADRLAGDDKPAKNLHLQTAQRKLRRKVSGKVDQPTYNYLETIVNLVVMSILLDTGDTGKNHCSVLAYSGDQPVFQDFFANTHLEEAMEDVQAAKKEAGHPVAGIVISVPAPEVSGSLNETLVMYETAAFGDYELTEKKEIVGAVCVGADLMGKPSPNDHKSPLSFVSAVYRHFGDSSTTVAEGTPYEYVVHLDRSEKSKLSKSHERVWDDLIEDHCSDFKTLLTDSRQRFDFDFLEDGKPNSYSQETYETWLDEQISDERFYTCDNAMCDLLSHTKATQQHMQQLKATAACKKGEDSARARAVITPGVAGSEGLHQARTSPMVKALEALHAIQYNHTNLKGLTEETKRIRFADFLRAVPKGALVWGTDKSKNDACFREAVWKKCVQYLAVMNDVFEERVVTRAYAFSPNEATADQSFPTGTLDLKYWIVKLTPLLAILLSGIGPTSFFNRLESTVENGTTVLEVYGEEGYQKWRVAERRAVTSVHPAWSQHPQPHVAEFVDWSPLAPTMVTDTTVKANQLTDDQIKTHHMGIYEGDDQAHVLLPPSTPEWAGLSVKDSIMKYTSRMSQSTSFIFEAALTADELDMVGRNSVFEMLSAWIGLPTGKADAYEVAVIVPKILKALRKIPHITISSQHTLVLDEHEVPVDVVRDETFWSLALTKFYALAIMNRESLGVRGLFLSHGDYCYEHLERLVGKQGAHSFATTYGDRDPERRQIEEASSTTFSHCGVMREQAHEAVNKVSVERVIRTCCTAWRAELPDLVNEPRDKIVAALLAFDTIARSLEITDQIVSDPMMLWLELDIGCLLEPLVKYATGNHRKIAATFRSPGMLADSEHTVQLARKLAGVKPTGTATKDSRPDTAAGGEKGKSKGKGKSDPAPDATDGVCRQFQKGECTRGSACRFAHTGEAKGKGKQKVPKAQGGRR